MHVRDGLDALDVTLAAGEVELGSTTGKVVVRGAAVQLLGRAAGPGSLDFRTAAGGAPVAVVPRTTVELDMTSATGAVRCELPPESDLRGTGGRLDLRLRSATGNLLVTSAPAD